VGWLSVGALATVRTWISIPTMVSSRCEYELLKASGRKKVPHCQWPGSIPAAMVEYFKGFFLD